MITKDTIGTINIKEKRQLLTKEYANKTREEITEILNDLNFRKNFIENSMEGIYTLNNGNNVVWGRGEPSAFFDVQAEERYKKIGEEIIKAKNLDDGRKILQEKYFAPYMVGHEQNLQGHINTIKATELYPMIYNFIQDNDILRSEDGQCCIQFPIVVRDNEHINHIYFHITQKLKKAFICSQAFDVIRLNGNKLESYQDFLDDKRL